MSNKTKKKRPPMSNSKKKRKKDIERTVKTVNAVRMASLLALRDEGYGQDRLLRFNNKFNTILLDVSQGRLSLADILEAIKEETGITQEVLEWNVNEHTE